MRKLIENKGQHRVVAAFQSGQRAFTLIEILIVIALSVLLFGLLLKPLISSLQYTKEAQALAAAQDSSRKVVEMMNRELGSAAYVFDNRSHPFKFANQAVGKDLSGDDLYTNFLNLEIPTVSNGRTIAHCYDAKLDIVMARHKGNSTTLLDPTSPSEPISVTAGGVVTATELQFPLAPGTSIVRYFIGLKTPAKLVKTYSNLNEQRANAQSDNNTYVLYRAQVNPYKAGQAVNDTYFATATNGNPEFDDPDFFRYVNDAAATFIPGRPGDVNWLSSDHHIYTTVEAQHHNDRVDAWIQIAKPVVTAPDIDLLVLPRNADGGIDYDTTGGPLNGIPHFGSAIDPTTGAANNPSTGTTEWPIVRSSMIFRPASITSEAVPATTTDYVSLGLPVNSADTGLPYIPSVYTTTSKSWAMPYTIRLYPNAYVPGTDKYYTIESANSEDNITPLITGNDTAGDIIEYYVTPTPTPTWQPVYNVSTGLPEAAYTATPMPETFIPLVVDSDKGTISFDIGPNPTKDVNSDTPPFWPPLIPNQKVPVPTPTTWPPTATVDYGNTFWYFGSTDIAQPTPVKGVGNNMIDTTKLADSGGILRSPLGLITNAILVPGSVRIYGPDTTPGPNNGVSVLYTAVSPNTIPAGNQYLVDYATGIITFPPQLPTTKGTSATAADPIQLAFHYQANVSGTPPFSTTNQAHSMRVTVDYQTRDLIEVNVGVRVYRPGTSTAQIISASNNVAVGNSNR